MVVSYTQEHVYRHPWHRVTAAAWRKFTDPAACSASGELSHILDVQTLSRDVDARSGRLRAVRAITGRTPPLPFLLRGVAGAAGVDVVVLCVETTDVDAPSRGMRVDSRNANLRGLVDVQERCSYEPHPARPDEWTLFRQEVPPSGARRWRPWRPGWLSSWSGAAPRGSRRTRTEGRRSWRGSARSLQRSRTR